MQGVLRFAPSFYNNLCRSSRCFRRGVDQLLWHVCFTQCFAYLASLRFPHRTSRLSVFAPAMPSPRTSSVPPALSLSYYVLGSELASIPSSLILRYKFYRAFAISLFIFILEFFLASCYYLGRQRTLIVYLLYRLTVLWLLTTLLSLRSHMELGRALPWLLCCQCFVCCNYATLPIRRRLSERLSVFLPLCNLPEVPSWDALVCAA